MSLELTGVHGLLKRHKLFTHKLNKKNQIISVVGNGGMGKTSTVIKILYDLIERDENPFEAVIWLTLKTKTLSHGEFVEIKDGIKEMSDVIEKSRQIMVSDSDTDAMETVVEFMNEFSTLLVLDNLETINTGEINAFLRRIPENSKVVTMPPAAAQMMMKAVDFLLLVPYPSDLLYPYSGDTSTLQSTL